MVAALPAAAVSPPSASTLLWWSILDNRRWIFGSLGFVLVFGYYFFAWRAVGRDPKAGTIIPLFHPPKDVSPALANYIHRWGFGREKWRAFTAAALSLAVRGLIEFDDSDETLTLKTLKKEPEGGMAALPPGERAILEWVNGRGRHRQDRPRPWQRGGDGRLRFHQQHRERKPQPLLPPQFRLCRRRRGPDRLRRHRHGRVRRPARRRLRRPVRASPSAA